MYVTFVQLVLRIVQFDQTLDANLHNKMDRQNKYGEWIDCIGKENARENYEPESPSRPDTMNWTDLLFAYHSTNQIRCFDKCLDRVPSPLYMETVWSLFQMANKGNLHCRIGLLTSNDSIGENSPWFSNWRTHDIYLSGKDAFSMRCIFKASFGFEQRSTCSAMTSKSGLWKWHSNALSRMQNVFSANGFGAPDETHSHLQPCLIAITWLIQLEFPTVIQNNVIYRRIFTIWFGGVAIGDTMKHRFDRIFNVRQFEHVLVQDFV